MTEIETLTEEERDWLQRFRHCPWPDVSRSAADAGVDAGAALRKLLRLHDALQARVKELEEQYARFAADTYEQEGAGPRIRDDKVRLMAWVMGGGDPDDPKRPGPPAAR